MARVHNNMCVNQYDQFWDQCFPISASVGEANNQVSPLYLSTNLQSNTESEKYQKTTSHNF